MERFPFQRGPHAGDKKHRLTDLKAGEDFSPGSWYYVVGVYDGEQMRIYVDQLEHGVFLCYAKEKLIVVGSKNLTLRAKPTVWYDVACFDAINGRRVWSATQDQDRGINGSHGEQEHHPAIVGDVVYVEPKAYDLHSGRSRAGWMMNRAGHGCGSISASASMCFFRAGNSTMCDLSAGEKRPVTKVSRPGCWINILPAGGMLLIPEASSGCTCDFAVQSSMAFQAAD